jgi:2-C-methyl-D-erythritol 4-phosphate cytidylyltransferase
VFLGHPAVGPVVLVGDRGELAEAAGGRVPIVPGGRTRHDSERNGLMALDAAVRRGDVGTVLVHDAARPFVTPGEIDRLLAEVARSGAAILAARVDASALALVEDDGSWCRPPGPLWAAQTPQGFDAGLALDAHRRAGEDGFEGTDTASVVQRIGHRVHLVEGSRANVKITCACSPGSRARWSAPPASSRSASTGCCR